MEHFRGAKVILLLTRMCVQKLGRHNFSTFDYILITPFAPSKSTHIC